MSVLVSTDTIAWVSQ